MQKLAFMSCLFLLTACQATSESEPAATEVIEPSFDCQKAQGQVEILICNDQELAALDRQMSEVYQAALANIPASAQPKAMQRGWVKGRNDCWKSQDVRQCTLDNYQDRIRELQIEGQLIKPLNSATFDCGEYPAITAVFYTQLDPVVGVFTFAEQKILANNVRSGSGAKYQGRNFEFWEHHGEASVQFLGDSYQCQLRP
ncbi:MliC family protein [Shewanella sp. 10N.261.52.F9]|uniref:MliC family protein n=1 Tax=Shewanella sp. 10N.261.52.F9 TaxID=3229684 RepID=UPI0035531395